MPAYWIARSKIEDRAEYKKYTDLVPSILEKYGGKVLSRGAEHRTLEGPAYFERFVLIEFESMEAAVRCFESDEYRSAAAFRRNGAAKNELTVFEAGTQHFR